MITKTAPLQSDGLTAEEEADFRPESLEYLVEVISGPEQGTTISLGTASAVVGSAVDCDLRLTDTTVSRRHLKLEKSAQGVWARDLESRNGTFVNGVRVEGLVVRREALITVGTTVLRIAGSERTTNEPTSFGEVVGQSPAMRELFKGLRRAAPTNANVLLLGETGTGKDIIARAIHAASARRHRPFVVVDCASLSPTLIESELFGHARGAFTGANSDRDGAFVSARGGTLFIDELGELPLALQPRLLRALENRTIRRLGEDTERAIDVRFVAATHRDLLAQVRNGTFREDLYFRLAVVTAVVPPLRERRDDLPLLIATLLARAGRPEFSLSPTLLAELAAHHWPGNVRELRNVVERAIHGQPAGLTPSSQPRGDAAGVPFKEAKEALVENFTREYFSRLFEASGRNVAAMARAAGVARTYAHELIKKYGLK